MEIKFVQQKCSKSCVVACTAMIINKPFDYVRNLVSNVPTKNSEMRKIILDHGFKILFEREFKELLTPGFYTCAVPSLNILARMHQIIIDYTGEKAIVYDPAKGLQGKKYYSLSGLYHSNNEHSDGGYDLHNWYDVYKIIR
jgi:hypothetical protein